MDQGRAISLIRWRLLRHKSPKNHSIKSLKLHSFRNSGMKAALVKQDPHRVSVPLGKRNWADLYSKFLKGESSLWEARGCWILKGKRYFRFYTEMLSPYFWNLLGDWSFQPQEPDFPLSSDNNTHLRHWQNADAFLSHSCFAELDSPILQQLGDSGKSDHIFAATGVMPYV